MISLITNATFLVFCFAFLLVLLFRCRMSQWNLSSEEALERTLCILTSRPALIIVICGAFINIGFRIYNGYINPGDLMLDVVVAQQYRVARLLTRRDTPVVHATVADELLNQLYGVRHRVRTAQAPMPGAP